jgi:hypothetical protein
LAAGKRWLEMGKSKRRVPFAASKAAGAKQNPFEALNTRKKFNVIGKKSSDVKNINRARSEAVDRVCPFGSNAAADISETQALP